MTTRNRKPRNVVAARASVGLLLPGIIALAGCRGISTPGERNARAGLQSVAKVYRPDGPRPQLPALTADAGLDVFVQYALLNQPRVEAAYYDWAASIERITTARSLPDPQLTFQADIQNILTSLMPGFVMTFPGPGKLRAGADVATAESQSKYFAFESAVLNAAFDLKRAFYQLHFLEEKISVSRDTLKLLTDLEGLARAQNEVGKVTLQDVLRAQIEQDRVRTDLANLDDSRNSILAGFKAALGLHAGDPAPPIPSRFESTQLDLTANQVFEAALAHNPRIKGMEADLRVAQAGLELAAMARRPDSSVGLMADAKTSPVLYRPLATVSLPLWRDKIAAQISEAQANKRSAEARLSAEQIALAVDFAEKSYMVREATRNLALLHDQLLPKAQQSLEVARIGYLSGQLDFFNLSDTERTLLGFRLDEVEARSQRELSLAELSLMVLGVPPAGAPQQRGPSAETPASQPPQAK